MISFEQEKKQIQKKKISHASFPTPPRWTSDASDGIGRAAHLSSPKTPQIFCSSSQGGAQGLDRLCIL